MKSKIEKKLKKKTNKKLVETIIKGKKNQWIKVIDLISNPVKKRINLNLEDIDSQSKEGEKIVVPGKVLGNGEIRKKIEIIALDFSKTAEEKLKKEKINYSIISEHIEKNPEAKDIKILTGKENE